MVEKKPFIDGEQTRELSIVLEDSGPITKPADINSDPEIRRFMKPFVNAGSAAIAVKTPWLLALLFGRVIFPEPLAKTFTSQIPSDSFTAFVKRMPSFLLVCAVKRGMVLGPFEFLTRKVGAANKDIPPSLYQEVGCGVASGAIGAFINTPLELAFTRIEKSNGSHSNVLRDIYDKATKKGILALWKGGCPVANRMFAGNVGLLASYNPSFNYLRESVGLSERKSVLGAGLISGFCAATCSYPFEYVHKTMKNMRLDVNAKYPYSSYLDCALKMLKFNSPRHIFRGYMQYTLIIAPHIMALWYCYDGIKRLDKSQNGRAWKGEKEMPPPSLRISGS